MKKYFKLILLLGISLIFLSGCISDLVVPVNDSNTPATEGGSTDENPAGELDTGKGTLKIYLTDAPGDYLEVNIIISKIEGHIAVEDEEGYWEELKDWPGGLPVDLIKLEDVSMLLASLELEANKYTQLRLFLMGGEEDAWVVIEGSEGPEGSTSIEFLEIPSSANTGIKLNRPLKYKMKPVINVTSEIYSEEEVSTGSVSGSVSYYQSGNFALTGIGGASVSLSGGEYIFVYNTTTSGDGSFNFLGNVPIGNCVLNVYADDFDDYSESIIVGVGENTVVDVVLLAEEPGVISGIVVDSDGGDPIGEATVSVTLSSGVYTFNSSASTNENGEFMIEQLPVGIYDLTVSAINYVGSSVSGIPVTEGGLNNSTPPIELVATL